MLLWRAGGGPRDGGGGRTCFDDGGGAARWDADELEREVGATGEGAELRGDLIGERCAEDAFAWRGADDQRTHGGEAIGDADDYGGGARPRGAVADASGERDIAGGASDGVVAYGAAGGVQQGERAGGGDADDLPRYWGVFRVAADQDAFGGNIRDGDQHAVGGLRWIVDWHQRDGGGDGDAGVVAVVGDDLDGARGGAEQLAAAHKLQSTQRGLCGGGRGVGGGERQNQRCAGVAAAERADGDAAVRYGRSADADLSDAIAVVAQADDFSAQCVGDIHGEVSVQKVRRIQIRYRSGWRDIGRNEAFDPGHAAARQRDDRRSVDGLHGDGGGGRCAGRAGTVGQRHAHDACSTNRRSGVVTECDAAQQRLRGGDGGLIVQHDEQRIGVGARSGNGADDDAAIAHVGANLIDLSSSRALRLNQ